MLLFVSYYCFSVFSMCTGYWHSSVALLFRRGLVAVRLVKNSEIYSGRMLHEKLCQHLSFNRLKRRNGKKREKSIRRFFFVGR